MGGEAAVQVPYYLRLTKWQRGGLSLLHKELDAVGEMDVRLKLPRRFPPLCCVSFMYLIIR